MGVVVMRIAVMQCSSYNGILAVAVGATGGLLVSSRVHGTSVRVDGGKDVDAINEDNGGLHELGGRVG